MRFSKNKPKRMVQVVQETLQRHAMEFMRSLANGKGKSEYTEGLKNMEICVIVNGYGGTGRQTVKELESPTSK